MIQGRIPELIIKFSEKPFLPTEGKKVLVEIQGERNVKVKAEVNRKTLKKQVAKMDEYDDWIGALSGKILSINDGLTSFQQQNTQSARILAVVVISFLILVSL